MSKSLCGVGYMEGRLEMIEKAVAEGKSPGQAVLDRIPKDKETGLLRVSACPTFATLVLDGESPDEALKTALYEDVNILMKACKHVWEAGNAREDLSETYEVAVADLVLTLLNKDIHLVGAGRSMGDYQLGDKLKAGASLDFYIYNIRFLVDNLWKARAWRGQANRRIAEIEKAVAVFINELPYDALRRGKVKVQADRERMRAEA